MLQSVFVGVRPRLHHVSQHPRRRRSGRRGRKYRPAFSQSNGHFSNDRHDMSFNDFSRLNQVIDVGRCVGVCDIPSNKQHCVMRYLFNAYSLVIDHNQAWNWLEMTVPSVWWRWPGRRVIAFHWASKCTGTARKMAATRTFWPSQNVAVNDPSMYIHFSFIWARRSFRLHVGYVGRFCIVIFTAAAVTIWDPPLYTFAIAVQYI